MSLLKINQDRVTMHREESVATLLQYANNKRVAGLFNDVTIQAGAESIPANRMVLSCYCKFFETMFLTEFKEQYQDRVEIHQFDGNAVKSIIQYIYTGCIDIDADNVMNLLATADFLQIDDVKRFCFDYFESTLTIDNCIDIVQASLLYRNPSPMKETYQIISNNFEKIVQTENFKCLSKHDLISVLEKLDKTKVEELSIYKAIVEWVGQVENRKTDFTDLFLKLDLHRFPIQFLEDVVANEPLVQKNSDCLNAVVFYTFKKLRDWKPNKAGQVVDSQLNFDVQNADSRSCNVSDDSGLLCVGGLGKKAVLEIYNTSGKDKKRFPNLPIQLSRHCALKLNDIVYCIGGAVNDDRHEPTNKVYRLNLKAGKLRWEKLSSMIEKRCSFGAAVIADDIVVAGGENGTVSLKTAELYNTRSNKWSRISPMIYRRHGHSLVAARGRIYAIGGFVGDKVLKYVERFIEFEGIWEEIQPMNIPRSYFAAVQCDGFIFVIAGRSDKAVKTVEKYDPAINQWSFVMDTNVDRELHAACVLDGKIHVVGGVYAGDTMEIYDKSDGQWNLSYGKEFWVINPALVAI